MNSLKISDKMVETLKKYEGLSLVPYLCPAAKLTIGYGHVISSIEKKKGELCIVVLDDKFQWIYFGGAGITDSEADTLLRSDLMRYEAAVLRSVKVVLTQDQFDALVSFTFNVGIGALQKSTLLGMLNDGDYAGACEQFLRWNKVAGKVFKGLTKRRAHEAKVFTEGVYA